MAPLFAGGGERSSMGAAEEEQMETDREELINMDQVRTRQDLAKMINSAADPLEIKKEIIADENLQFMDQETDSGDVEYIRMVCQDSEDESGYDRNAIADESILDDSRTTTARTRRRRRRTARMWSLVRRVMGRIRIMKIKYRIRLKLTTWLR